MVNMLILPQTEPYECSGNTPLPSPPTHTLPVAVYKHSTHPIGTTVSECHTMGTSSDRSTQFV